MAMYINMELSVFKGHSRDVHGTHKIFQDAIIICFSVCLLQVKNPLRSANPLSEAEINSND